MGSSARDHFDDDDDDVYSQPVESNSTANGNVHNGNALPSTNNGHKSPATTPVSSYSKPPLIPSRLKKVSSMTGSIGAGSAIVDSEYIIMPPHRLREIVDGRNNSNSTSPTPPPSIPPKPSPGNNNGNNNGRITSPPPPLLPRYVTPLV